MKLTDEQRDHWNGYIKWAQKNGMNQVTVDVTAIELLVSSEQAWKEEATEMRKKYHEAVGTLWELCEKEGIVSVKDYLSSLGEKE